MSFVRTLFSLLEIAGTFPVWGVVLLSRLIGKQLHARVFCTMSQALSILPGDPGNFVRRGFYRMTLDSCSARCTISFGTIFSSPHVTIGPYVYIGAYCSIADCRIEADCMLGSFVSVLNGKRTHHFDRVDLAIRLQGGESHPVTLHRDCWIGNGAIVMTDVGPGAVVGAGAVVTRMPDALSINVGNPARRVGTRGQ